MSEQPARWATVPLAVNNRVVWFVAALEGELNLEDFAVVDKVTLTINQHDGDVARYYLTGKHIFTDKEAAALAVLHLNGRTLF